MTQNGARTYLHLASTSGTASKPGSIRMKMVFLRAIAVAGAAMLVWTAAAVAQPPAGPRPQASTAVIDSTGQPWRGDLSGVWQPPYTSDLTRGTQAALTPWGQERFAKFNGTLDPCLPQGVTRQMNAPDPIEIIQTPKKIAILYESWHIFRSIPTDGRAHPKDVDPTWFGNSVAKWEDDTLVIDVVGMYDKTTLDTVGHPHSDEVHLVERLRRTGPTTMSYEVTVDDPKAYVAPWKQSRVLQLKPGIELMEYVCLENEKDRSHLVGTK
ncbi:MAG: hypothetical protein ABI824_14625 [Acidobacteriota bacterium]